MSFLKKLFGFKEVTAQAATNVQYEHFMPDGRLESRPVVYEFEHKVLPKNFFSQDEKLEQLLGLQSPSQEQELETIFHYWRVSKYSCEYNQLIRQSSLEEFMQYATPLIQATSIERITIGSFSVWLLTFPQPILDAEAYFAACCLSLEGHRRYLTLEFSSFGGAMLGEWTATEVHQLLVFNGGNTRDDFIAALEQHLANEN